jgi:hypothetical protein
MNFVDHATPHFHATYGDEEAQVEIATGDIIGGSLPRRAAVGERVGRTSSRRTPGQLDATRAVTSAGKDRSAPMKCLVTHVCSRGNHQLEVVYADGLSANLDFTNFLAEHEGPIVEPLRDEQAFSAVRLEDGVVTWSTGFDICPDVLRFWCEQGRVCSERETNARFEVQRPLTTP